MEASIAAGALEPGISPATAETREARPFSSGAPNFELPMTTEADMYAAAVERSTRRIGQCMRYRIFQEGFASRTYEYWTWESILGLARRRMRPNGAALPVLKTSTYIEDSQGEKVMTISSFAAQARAGSTSAGLLRRGISSAEFTSRYGEGVRS